MVDEYFSFQQQQFVSSSWRLCTYGVHVRRALKCSALIPHVTCMVQAAWMQHVGHIYIYLCVAYVYQMRAEDGGFTSEAPGSQPPAHGCSQPLSAFACR